MDPLYSVMSAQPSIDLKANGEVSRMRNHKGNMPSLPQTKYCPLCPAKFTRTTHLNRHLRSHTNERLHRCNICNAEFTRSDLLTRHKRTCGDSSNANRSRRKSCQACAESKVKCNLQYPCSKCTSRGRECVFINDPEQSRIKKLAAKRKHASCSSVSSSGSASPASSTNSLFAESLTSSPASFSTSFPSFSPNCSISGLPMVSPVPSLPSLTVSPGSSSASSLQASPRSDFFDNQIDLSTTFDLNFDGFSLENELSKPLDNEIFAPLLDFSTCSVPSSTTSSEFSWLEGSNLLPTFGDDTYFPSSTGLDQQTFITDFSSLESTLNASPCAQPTLIDPIIPASEAWFPSASVNAQAPVHEQDQYLFLFFSEFCKQVPLVHPATWKMDDKPVVLVRAMQACGALFVKTAAAATFIDETLSTRDSLIQDFARATDPRDQNNLILTVVLLQTIGLFHQKADQRISSNVYHGMLVMMIRRTGLISRVGAWTPPDMAEIHGSDAAWREWANYETIKRVLFLSYLHDCYHCMYFSLSPSFQPSEIDMALPCDNALWIATDPNEWSKLIQTPSPYGSGGARISGFSMKRALAILSETRLSTVSLALNPFAHFILIHTVLRNIFAAQADVLDMGHHQAPPANKTQAAEDHAFATQYALHNWLQMWLNSPESMQVEKRSEEPPFVCDALPFYWLAQVSLLAVQDGSAIFGTGESRFQLMKEWLDHIRAFLRSGNQVPTHLWDELMKIRVKMSQERQGAAGEQSTGLLALFPNH